MSGAPILLQIALRIGGLAIVAVGGGNALIPALHEQAVSVMHWLSDAQFGEAVGLSQIAPGPNMLIIPLIGGQTAGIAGAAVALAAFLLPSTTIAILGSRFLVRHDGSPAVVAFRWSLRPVTTGLMLSASSVLIGTAARTWPSPVPADGAGMTLVALVVAGLSLRFKRNPLIWLAAAALVGAAL